MKNTVNNILKLLSQIFVTIGLLMLLVYFFETDVFQINICDSGSINDINEINDTINVNEDERNIAHLNNLPLADRIRRRISWYLTAKGRKKYGSYNEFKST
jgi:hypothetical protein